MPLIRAPVLSRWKDSYIQIRQCILSLSHLVQNTIKSDTHTHTHIYISISFCIYVCVCACTRVFARVHVYVVIQGWYQVSSLTVLFYIIHWSNLLLNLETALWLGRLASLLWNPYPYLLPAMAAMPTWLLCGFWAFKIQSSLTHSLSHLLSPIMGL